jgi:hypothetical protein
MRKVFEEKSKLKFFQMSFNATPVIAGPPKFMALDNQIIAYLRSQLRGRNHA